MATTLLTDQLGGGNQNDEAPAYALEGAADLAEIAAATSSSSTSPRPSCRSRPSDPIRRPAVSETLGEAALALRRRHNLLGGSSR